MTAQVKIAIQEMKDSGFKRNEFKCQASRKGSEYGNAQIYGCDLKKITENEKIILKNGLGIIRIICIDGKINDTITTSYEYEGKIKTIDIRKFDE